MTMMGLLTLFSEAGGFEYVSATAIEAFAANPFPNLTPNLTCEMVVEGIEMKVGRGFCRALEERVDFDPSAAEADEGGDRN